MASSDQPKQQQQQLMTKFATDLKSRNEWVRNKAAKDLHMYVYTELREVGQEELNTFLDEFNHHIFEMVSGDTHAKMGGILAIVALINADVCNTGTRISRYILPWFSEVFLYLTFCFSSGSVTT